jgi:hypothetical protein
MTSEIETEVIRRVYGNAKGEYVTVSPDDDGLGIVQVHGNDDFGGMLLLSPDHAIAVARAIMDCARELKAAAP